MDIEIANRIENPLLHRSEVKFQISHLNEQTPTRDSIREKLAGQLDAKKGLIVVTRMNSEFGRGRTNGTAHVYSDEKALGEVERSHVLKRNKLENLKPSKKKEA